MPYIKTLIVAFDSWRKFIEISKKNLEEKTEIDLGFFCNDGAHGLLELSRNKLVDETEQFDEQRWYENYRVA